MNSLQLPKFDVDALVALQKANVEAMVQAQQILLEAAEVALKAQVAFAQENATSVQAVMNGKLDVERKPEAYLDDFKMATGKGLTVAQTQVDLALKAQSEAFEILTKRIAANVDDVQKLAA
ncbi:MAG: hypothetical protein AAFX81_13190 [Pseudomonadota bacterium]